MLKIRLRRTGGTNAPAYRIVVSDSRRTPTAMVIGSMPATSRACNCWIWARIPDN